MVEKYFQKYKMLQQCTISNFEPDPRLFSRDSILLGFSFFSCEEARMNEQERVSVCTLYVCVCVLLLLRPSSAVVSCASDKLVVLHELCSQFLLLCFIDIIPLCFPEHLALPHSPSTW